MMLMQYKDKPSKLEENIIELNKLYRENKRISSVTTRRIIHRKRLS
jgi:hypothetical protein